MSTATATGEQSQKHLIVLVHGGASSGRMYREVIPRLEQHGFECVAPDLPGHGSAAEERPFTFSAASMTVINAISGRQSSAPEERKVMVVGISLGGQVVLDFLQSAKPGMVDAAIVSGASINPPDEDTPWEIPHMPSDQTWLDLMMEDVRIAGMEHMPDLQAKSLGFTFEASPPLKIPPTLVVVGQHDTAMSRRDFPLLTQRIKNLNDQSDSLIMQDAWHNHSIDVPELFSNVILDWAKKVWNI